VTRASMSLGDGVVVVAAAVAEVAEAGAVEGVAAGLDVDAVAAAEAEAADEPVVDAVVGHTDQPTDSSLAVVVAAAALQTQAPYSIHVVVVAFAESAQVEPHTRDTSGTAAAAGRTDYAEVALELALVVGASRMAQVAHTAQAGVADKVDEAAAIPSVRGTMKNSRKDLAAVVRSRAESRLWMM